MTLANEVKREYPIKALFDSFVAGKRLAVDEVREALNPAANLREQLNRAMELVLMLATANEGLRKQLQSSRQDEARLWFEASATLSSDDFRAWIERRIGEVLR